MGLPIPPPPIDYGNNCVTCTPTLWANGQTPTQIYCTFWGISGCGVSPFDPPNGEIFIMDQSIGNPCIWAKTTGTWRPDFIAGGLGGFKSRLRLFDQHGFSFFGAESFNCRPEYWRYINIQAVCMLMFAGAGGFGTIFWLDFVHTLISEVGFDTSHKIFYEFFGRTAFTTVHKICDQYQRTNIRVMKGP